VWHGDSHKRKLSGGRKRAHRKKRRFERGAFPTETTLGERKVKIGRRRGSTRKRRLLKGKSVNICDPATGKTEKTEIMRVTKNPANIDYDRRGVITKGTLIETQLGPARVTSRPGQHGLINAVLVPEKQ
jgi:small subunit ribosomal protein S8e